MVINIEINTVSRKAVYDLLPSDWQKGVSEILEKKGKKYHPNTLTKAFKTSTNLTPAAVEIIKASIEYLEKLKSERKMAVSESLAKEIQEYRPTGS